MFDIISRALIGSYSSADMQSVYFTALSDWLLNEIRFTIKQVKLLNKYKVIFVVDSWTLFYDTKL